MIVLAGGIGGQGMWVPDDFLTAQSAMRLVAPALRCIKGLCEVYCLKRALLDMGLVVHLVQTAVAGPNALGQFPLAGEDPDVVPSPEALGGSDPSASTSHERTGRRSIAAPLRRRKWALLEDDSAEVLQDAGEELSIVQAVTIGMRKAFATSQAAGAGSGSQGGNASPEEGFDTHSSERTGRMTEGGSEVKEEDGWSEIQIRRLAEIALRVLVRPPKRVVEESEAKQRDEAHRAITAGSTDRSGASAFAVAGRPVTSRPPVAPGGSSKDQQGGVRAEQAAKEAEDRIEKRQSVFVGGSKSGGGGPLGMDAGQMVALVQASKHARAAKASPLREEAADDDAHATKQVSAVLKSLLTPGLYNMIRPPPTAEERLATARAAAEQEKSSSSGGSASDAPSSTEGVTPTPSHESFVRVALKGRPTEKPHVIWTEHLRRRLLRRLSHEAAYVDQRAVS